MLESDNSVYDFEGKWTPLKISQLMWSIAMGPFVIYIGIINMFTFGILEFVVSIYITIFGIVIILEECKRRGDQILSNFIQNQEWLHVFNDNNNYGLFLMCLSSLTCAFWISGSIASILLTTRGMYLFEFMDKFYKKYSNQIIQHDV